MIEIYYSHVIKYRITIVLLPFSLQMSSNSLYRNMIDKALVIPTGLENTTSGTSFQKPWVNITTQKRKKESKIKRDVSLALAQTNKAAQKKSQQDKNTKGTKSDHTKRQRNNVTTPAVI